MKKLCVVILLFFLNSPAWAGSFESFVNSLKNEAKEKGYTQSVIDEAFNNVELMQRATYQSTHQAQAINPFIEYYAMTVTPTRVATGSMKMRDYRTFLKKISMEYQVPEQYIVALWGLESNYGVDMGNYNEFSALTSLAYRSDRPKLFRSEIFDALNMLQEHQLSSYDMKGSWAGAMGQCQFMPSSYLLFATAYQHKGPPDIWGTTPDVFASIAKYLKQEGWNSHYDLLFKVKLTRYISHSKMGLGTQKPVTAWLKLGVKSQNGENLLNEKGNYSLLLPDGKSKSAFLVNWNNFRVILRWNASEFYAISVGSLANRLKEKWG